jgi:UDP-N-acetyl-D-glucosamine dehydrogenase
MPFYPGPGLGGHCIPIDPFYLAWKAREYGKHTRFIELAGEINTLMPEYVVNRVAEALNSKRKALNGSKVLVIGLAYKANVDDMRESATFHIMDLLQARKADVFYHDPFIPEIGPTREHRNWMGARSVDWNRETISSFDAAVIATAHKDISYRELVQWSECIVDTRNVLTSSEPGGATIWKA